MSVTTTGWIRDGHTIDIEVNEDGEIFYHLNHPSECHQSRQPFGDQEDGTPFFFINYHCMIGFECNTVGITGDNHAGDGTPSEPLPYEQLEKEIMAARGYLENVPIEYWVEYGTTPSTPMHPEEYVWLVAWRLVAPGRDEDMATIEQIDRSHGHPQD